MAARPLHSDPSALAQLLDEHHLVVLGAEPRRRALTSMLVRYLRGLPETLVVGIGGPGVVDPASLVRQLAEALDVEHRIEHEGAVCDLADALRALPASWQRVYFLWHDAEAMLESDPHTFSRIVNTVLGIAAEREHLSREALVLERWLFLGDGKLGAYAGDDAGQFRSWLNDDGATPFWDVATVVEQPRVLTVRLDG